MKESLAIFGGEPVRKTKIFYGKQDITESDVKEVARVMMSDLITQGPEAVALEKALCQFTGAKYCSMVSNGTAALHIAALAADIQPGDEVIVTPITFAASANCILYCGGIPVFADIHPETYNIDPEDIRRKITSKTKAIVAVDFTGQPVEADAIRRICDEFNLIFIEDAAHSIASSYKGKMVGNIADITTMSFHPVKTITGGEGGAILTNDPDLHHKISLYRTHGITKDETQYEYENEGTWYHEQQLLGYNYRITDFQSALIHNQFRRIDSYKARRQEIVKQYNDAFDKIPELIVQKEIDGADSCRHLYVLRLNFDKLNCNRKQFFDALSAENVQPQVHYIPTYYFPYYQRLGYKKGLCPNAEAYYDSALSLPLYPKLTDEDVKDVIKAVKKICAYYAKR